MAIVLFDTNIFIDHFKQHHEATEELLNYVDSVISSITWIEVACRFSEPDKREFAHFATRLHHQSDGRGRRARHHYTQSQRPVSYTHLTLPTKA